jgi:hypothetical protein
MDATCRSTGCSAVEYVLLGGPPCLILLVRAMLVDESSPNVRFRVKS